MDGLSPPRACSWIRYATARISSSRLMRCGGSEPYNSLHCSFRTLIGDDSSEASFSEIVCGDLGNLWSCMSLPFLLSGRHTHCSGPPSKPVTVFAPVRLPIAFDRSLRGRNRANIRRQPIWLRRITEWKTRNCRTVMGIDHQSSAPFHSPRGSETMLLDQPEARPFERRSDVNRSRRSWFVATAAAPTLLRVSSGGAIGVAGSVSPNGTVQQRGPRKPGSRSSAHRTTRDRARRGRGPFFSSTSQTHRRFRSTKSRLRVRIDCAPHPSLESIEI